MAVIEKGELITAGPRDEVLGDADLQALLAFDANQLPPWPAPLYRETAAQHEEALIKLRDVSVSYGGQPVFEDISLEVQAGQHTLITGPNGAGKSTLLGLITGDHPQCYSNDIEVLGYRRGSGESIWDLKKRMGLVSPALHRDHRVPGSALHIVLGGFHDSIGLYQDPSDQEIGHAKAWLTMVGLKDRTRCAFKQLSYGEQRLALIARALVKQPALLILDEPTQGLDDINRHRVMYFLEHLSSQTDTTIILVSHREDEHLPLFKQHLALTLDG